MTERDKVIACLLEALTVDGSHHKQYYIEKALRFFTTEDEMAKILEGWEWESGIPA